MWILLHEGQKVFLGVMSRISDNMLADFTGSSCRVICRSQFAPVQSERALQPFDQQATIRKQMLGGWVEFHGRRQAVVNDSPHAQSQRKTRPYRVGFRSKFSRSILGSELDQSSKTRMHRHRQRAVLFKVATQD